MDGPADSDELLTHEEGNFVSVLKVPDEDIDGDGVPDTLGATEPGAEHADPAPPEETGGHLPSASVDENQALLTSGMAGDVVPEGGSWEAPAAALPEPADPIYIPVHDLPAVEDESDAASEASTAAPIDTESAATDKSADADASPLSDAVADAGAPDLAVDSAVDDTQRIGLIVWDEDLEGDGFTESDTGDSYSDYSYGSYDYSGYWADSAGDVNGDGFDDHVVTTYSWTDDVYSSATYVVFGDESGVVSGEDAPNVSGSDGFRIDGAADAYGSTSVAAAGDVNGDGFDDLLVGTYGWGASGNAFVVFGGADGFPAALDVSALDASRGFRIEGLEGGEYDSWSIGAGGDVNGDGLADLVVDVWRYATDGSYSSSSYILFGDSDGFGSSVDIADLEEVEPEEPTDDAPIFVELPYEPCVLYPVDEPALDPAFLRAPVDDLLA